MLKTTKLWFDTAKHTSIIEEINVKRRRPKAASILHIDKKVLADFKTLQKSPMIWNIPSYILYDYKLKSNKTLVREHRTDFICKNLLLFKQIPTYFEKKKKNTNKYFLPQRIFLNNLYNIKKSIITINKKSKYRLNRSRLTKNKFIVKLIYNLNNKKKQKTLRFELKKKFRPKTKRRNIVNFKYFLHDRFIWNTEINSATNKIWRTEVLSKFGEISDNQNNQYGSSFRWDFEQLHSYFKSIDYISNKDTKNIKVVQPHTSSKELVIPLLAKFVKNQILTLRESRVSKLLSVETFDDYIKYLKLKKSTYLNANDLLFFASTMYSSAKINSKRFLKKTQKLLHLKLQKKLEKKLSNILKKNKPLKYPKKCEISLRRLILKKRKEFVKKQVQSKLRVLAQKKNIKKKLYWMNHKLQIKKIHTPTAFKLKPVKIPPIDKKTQSIGNQINLMRSVTVNFFHKIDEFGFKDNLYKLIKYPHKSFIPKNSLQKYLSKRKKYAVAEARKIKSYENCASMFAYLVLQILKKIPRIRFASRSETVRGYKKFFRALQRYNLPKIKKTPKEIKDVKRSCRVYKKVSWITIKWLSPACKNLIKYLKKPQLTPDRLRLFLKTIGFKGFRHEVLAAMYSAHAAYSAKPKNYRKKLSFIEYRKQLKKRFLRRKFVEESYYEHRNSIYRKINLKKKSVQKLENLKPVEIKKEIKPMLEHRSYVDLNKPFQKPLNFIAPVKKNTNKDTSKKEINTSNSAQVKVSEQSTKENKVFSNKYYSENKDQKTINHAFFKQPATNTKLVEDSSISQMNHFIEKTNEKDRQVNTYSRHEERKLQNIKNNKFSEQENIKNTPVFGRVEKKIQNNNTTTAKNFVEKKKEKSKPLNNFETDEKKTNTESLSDNKYTNKKNLGLFHHLKVKNHPTENNTNTSKSDNSYQNKNVEQEKITATKKTAQTADVKKNIENKKKFFYPIIPRNIKYKFSAAKKRDWEWPEYDLRIFFITDPITPNIQKEQPSSFERVLLKHRRRGRRRPTPEERRATITKSIQSLRALRLAAESKNNKPNKSTKYQAQTKRTCNNSKITNLPWRVFMSVAVPKWYHFPCEGLKNKKLIAIKYELKKKEILKKKKKNTTKLHEKSFKPENTSLKQNSCHVSVDLNKFISYFEKAENSIKLDVLYMQDQFKSIDFFYKKQPIFCKSIFLFNSPEYVFFKLKKIVREPSRSILADYTKNKNTNTASTSNIVKSKSFLNKSFLIKKQPNSNSELFVPLKKLKNTIELQLNLTFIEITATNHTAKPLKLVQGCDNFRQDTASAQLLQEKITSTDTSFTSETNKKKKRCNQLIVYLTKVNAQAILLIKQFKHKATKLRYKNKNTTINFDEIKKKIKKLFENPQNCLKYTININDLPTLITLKTHIRTWRFILEQWPSAELLTLFVDSLTPLKAVVDGRLTSAYSRRIKSRKYFKKLFKTIKKLFLKDELNFYKKFNNLQKNVDNNGASLKSNLYLISPQSIRFKLDTYIKKPKKNHAKAELTSTILARLKTKDEFSKFVFNLERKYSKKNNKFQSLLIKAALKHYKYNKTLKNKSKIKFKDLINKGSLYCNSNVHLIRILPKKTPIIFFFNQKLKQKLLIEHYCEGVTRALNKKKNIIKNTTSHNKTNINRLAINIKLNSLNNQNSFIYKIVEKHIKNNVVTLGTLKKSTQKYTTTYNYVYKVYKLLKLIESNSAHDLFTSKLDFISVKTKYQFLNLLCNILVHETLNSNYIVKNIILNDPTALSNHAQTKQQKQLFFRFFTFLKKKNLFRFFFFNLKNFQKKQKYFKHKLTLKKSTTSKSYKFMFELQKLNIWQNTSSILQLKKFIINNYKSTLTLLMKNLSKTKSLQFVKFYPTVKKVSWNFLKKKNTHQSPAYRANMSKGVLKSLGHSFFYNFQKKKKKQFKKLLFQHLFLKKNKLYYNNFIRRLQTINQLRPSLGDKHIYLSTKNNNFLTLKPDTTINLLKRVFLNKRILETVNFRLYSYATGELLPARHKKGRTYFLNFRNKRMTTFRNARYTHWGVYCPHKTMKDRRYIKFLDFFLKKKNIFFISVLNYFQFRFEFSYDFWHEFVNIYKTFFNLKFYYKKIFQFPVSKTFWFFLRQSKHRKADNAWLMRKFLQTKYKIKRTFWMTHKRKIPKYFRNQTFSLSGTTNCIQFDFITHYFVFLKHLAKHEHNHTYIFENFMIKLNKFKFRS